MRRRAALLAACWCLSAASAFAQAPATVAPPVNDPRSLSERLRLFRIPDVVNTADAAERTRKRDELADVIETHLAAFVQFAIVPATAEASFREFLRTAARERVDEQLTGSPPGGGASGTASKTGLAGLFAVALESGAVTETVDQNLLTVRANADGLLRFLSNQDVFSPCSPGNPTCKTSWLKDIEVSASFNTADGGSATLIGTQPGNGAVEFTAPFGSNQFAAATVRYALLNERDLRSEAYREQWARWYAANRQSLARLGTDLLTSVNAAMLSTVTNPAYQDWRVATRARLQLADAAAASNDAKIAAIEAALEQRLNVLLALLQQIQPEFDRRLQDLSVAFRRYALSYNALGAALVTDPALTVEFTYAQPSLQPKIFMARVAYAYSPSGGVVNPGTFTANAALSFYKDPQPTGDPQNTARWKNVQLAFQFDRPLGPADSPASLSISGYYQYQRFPNIIVIPAGATALPGTSIVLPPGGTTLLGEKGSIYAFQTAFTLRLGDTGLKMPIGFSWSNRTELRTGREVRGQIGITIDTSSLFLLPGLR